MTVSIKTGTEIIPAFTKILFHEVPIAIINDVAMKVIFTFLLFFHFFLFTIQCEAVDLTHYIQDQHMLAQL
jgi:hypothetical protein